MKDKATPVEQEDSEQLRREHEGSLIRKLLDSPFILLVLSLLIVFTSYTLWGIMELKNVPPGILPK